MMTTTMMTRIESETPQSLIGDQGGRGLTVLFDRSETVQRRRIEGRAGRLFYPDNIYV